MLQNAGIVELGVIIGQLVSVCSSNRRQPPKIRFLSVRAQRFWKVLQLWLADYTSGQSFLAKADAKEQSWK